MVLHKLQLVEVVHDECMVLVQVELHGGRVVVEVVQQVLDEELPILVVEYRHWIPIG